MLGFNVEESWLIMAVETVHHKIGSISFKYLGLAVGADARKKFTWAPMVDKVCSTLVSCSSKYLSFGGRITLIIYVLSSLPTFYLSFFQAPKGIIHYL